MEVNYMVVFIAGNMFGDLCGIYDGAFYLHDSINL